MSTGFWTHSMFCCFMSDMWLKYRWQELEQLESEHNSKAELNAIQKLCILMLPFQSMFSFKDYPKTVPIGL